MLNSSRMLMVAGTLALAALGGCQATPPKGPGHGPGPGPGPADHPVINNPPDRTLSEFFGPGKFDLTLVDGKTLRGCTFVGSRGADDKDFALIKDWMGTEYLVRIEHITSIKR